VREQRARGVEHVGFVQRLADRDPGGSEEGVGDAAADDELVDLGEQRLQHRELGRDLGTGDDRDQGPCGLRERARQRVELAHQQRTCTGDRGEPRHPVGARLGTVGRAEGIHHEDVAERGHATRQRLVVFLLALVEAHVLAEHDLARRASDAIEPIALQAHRVPEQLTEPSRHRGERVGGGELAFFGPTEVREHDDARARRRGRAQGGQRRADARIARDDALLDRDVEVLADEHPLAPQVEVGHAQHGHRRGLREPWTRRAWCRACGWRSPTRCRTRRRP
jgi:hypothetical protein